MSAFIAVVITAALADNIVLGKMLGLCPFISLSRRLDIALGVGVATTAVLTVACALAWCLEGLLPEAFAPLRPLIFIAVVACAVQATTMLMQLTLPLIHRMLGVFLPLIATNCAILGIMLLSLQQENASFTQVVAHGLGGGLGFMLAIVAFALIRLRISEAQVPPTFRGAPLAVINAGWMALAFSGLAGAF
ncbi:MAG: electron transport complex subunit RsxA [Proteobacteria bacterium]|nr:electron transport complex subunit RsxA [Pseudomonadota bacterium]MCH9757659.1 electron transport complex subunit RsxA [Pseudomonadota bacterium]